MFGRRLVNFFAFTILLGPALGVSNPIQSDHIEVERLAETAGVVPGRPFRVGVRLTPDRHWKTYWRNAGGSGLPTRVQWRLPEGASAGRLQWLYAQRFEFQGVNSYGYDGEILLLAEIDPGTAPLPHGPLRPGRQSHLAGLRGNLHPGQRRPVATAAVDDASPCTGYPLTLFREARSRLPADAEGWWTVFAIEDGEFRTEAHSPAPCSPTPLTCSSTPTHAI